MEFVAIGGDHASVFRVRIERDQRQAHRAGPNGEREVIAVRSSAPNARTARRIVGQREARQRAPRGDRSEIAHGGKLRRGEHVAPPPSGRRLH